MMQAIRRHVRRLWPRSPLWVPALVILLCAIVYGIYYYPYTVDPKSFTLPRDRIVAGSYVHPEIWPPVPADERVFVHSVFGTSVHEASAFPPRGNVTMNVNSETQPIVMDQESETQLSSSFSATPLFYGIVPAAAKDSGDEGRFVDAQTGGELSERMAVSSCGISRSEFRAFWLNHSVDDIIVALKFTRNSRDQLPYNATLRDGRTGAVVDFLTPHVSSVSEEEAFVVMAFERPVLALDQLVLAVHWQDACQKSFDLPPTAGSNRVEYEPGRYSPEIVSLGSNSQVAGSDTQSAAADGNVFYLQIKSLIGDLRGSPRALNRSGTEVIPEIVCSEVKIGPEMSKLITLKFAMKLEDVSALRFYYRCPRYSTVLTLPEQIGAYNLADDDPDMMNHGIPLDWPALSGTRPLNFQTLLHAGATMIDQSTGPIVFASEQFKPGSKMRDVTATFFQNNPRLEIIQDFECIRFAPLGTAFLARHPWLDIIVGNRTIPQATVRYALYILFGWLLWAIIQSVRVTRDLRRKNYVHLSVARLLLLYLSTGSALRHLPSRDEAASLPDVDVQSWRSLRRFVIAQAGRK